MDATGTTSHSPFDKLFTRNVPHIIEKIFLSLDYHSFKSCLMVNKKWNQVLTVPHIYEKIFLSLDYYSFKSCLEVNKKWYQVLTSESFKKMGKPSFNKWLISAAKNGHWDIVPLLLRLGAETDNKSENNIDTPLHYAASNGHIDVVKVLLDGGADPNVETMNGWTPLHSAAKEGHKDVARLLIDAGLRSYQGN